MDPVKTGTIILKARKAHNMTQKDLADKLFVSDKAVSKWERGLCFPDISVLIPLTEILEISLYDLLKGENMNKNEIEETLKNTINYTNKEIKNKRKKIITLSLIIILIIITISIVAITYIKNKETGAIIDRDTIQNISYYSDYKTLLKDNNSEKIELIIMKLPLNWKERTFKYNTNSIVIKYNISYKELEKAYNDKNYIQKAIIDISTILFTTISDTDSIKIKFTDLSYTITKDKLSKAYNISNFENIIEESNWNETIQSKLNNKEFIHNTFKLYSVKKLNTNKKN